MTRTDLAAQMAERYARYCEMRDAGVRPVDCCIELGVSYDGTGKKYETAYRKARKIPPKRRQGYD